MSPKLEKGFVTFSQRQEQSAHDQQDGWGSMGWTFELLGYPESSKKNHLKIKLIGLQVGVDRCTRLGVNHTWKLH